MNNIKNICADHYSISNIEEYINSLPIDIVGLYLGYQNLSYLPDMSKFTQLKTLHFPNNNITELPNLPTSIEEIRAINNKLTYIPFIPSLTYLDVRNNNIHTIEINTTLKSLKILDNPCTHTDFSLFTGLTQLIVGHSTITSIQLPPFLEKLSITNTKITQLPAIPSTLISLSCEYNKLTSLPVLPENIERVFCELNDITELPILNHLNKLTCLSCYSNYITVLPELPPNLNDLNARHNLIEYLPYLPLSLTDIDIRHNHIKQLSLFDEKHPLKYLELYMNPIVDMLIELSYEHKYDLHIWYPSVKISIHEINHIIHKHNHLVYNNILSN